MATSPKKPVIPPVLRASKEINQFAEKTREAIGVLQGQRGNELDRAVTFRDALGDDFLKNLREGFRGIGGVPSEGDNNFDVPPIPTGFSARAGFEYAVLAWDEPTYSNHAYSEVFWHDSDDISAATRYGVAGGSLSVFLVDMEPDTTKYFWVRFVSSAGVAGQFNSTTGTPVTTAIDVTYVLGELTGQIREDQLFSDLADRIDLIDGASTLSGSVNARIAAEASARLAAVNSLQASIADLEGLPTWASGTSYALDDLVKYNGSIYKCIQATSTVAPSNSAYWEEIGAYDSLGGAIAGVASDLSDVESRVTTAEGTITATSTSLTTLQNAVNDTNTGLSSKASNSALNTAVSNIYGAAVSSFTNINAEFGNINSALNAKASIAQLNQAKTDIYGSAVSSFTNIDAAFSSQQNDINSRATVSQMNAAAASAESSAIASATTQVYSTLGGNESYVQSQVASWDGAGARWTTKTQVGDLVGGIGILNDGTSTRLYIQADRFAIYDSSLPANTDDLVPFIVTGGKTYIKSAAIQDATIEVAKIKDGFLDSLTAAKGTLAQARIAQGDIFNLTLGNTIQSSNFSSGSTGWRILKNGTVEFNGGIFRGAVRFLTSSDAANARADLNVADGADVTSQNTAAAIAGQGSLATQSSVTWSNQVTGAGKPADYADVTSQNTAAAIANQGSLATSNSANWGTQVSGTGKPADYADVTGSNTSYDTARVAGTSASSVRDQASAGAYASSRVNTWTRPTSTLIDGNKIFTGDAYVDTLQIKGNAVIVPAYDDLSVSSVAPNWPNWKTPTNGLPELTITLDVDCRIILLWFTRTSSQSSGAGDYQIRLYRGTTQIQYIPSYNNAAVHSGTIQQDLVAGTYTFSMQIRAYNAYLYDASIIALGVQR